MSQNHSEAVSVRFETDSLISVSPATANKLVEIMESASLEALIQLLLRNLAAETGVIPTSPLVAYPLQAKCLPKTQYKLEELMSNVTDENKHERIDFGKPVGREKL